jgi:6-phosphofructokinase 1
VHGLVDYVAGTIARWPHHHASPGRYPLTVATKATILGHTLRGAPPTPDDKAIAQHLGYETIRRLIERPETVVGCLLTYREPGAIESIPLHAVEAKPFDWEVFARMHGSEMT